MIIHSQWCEAIVTIIYFVLLLFIHWTSLYYSKRKSIFQRELLLYWIIYSFLQPLWEETVIFAFTFSLRDNFLNKLWLSCQPSSQKKGEKKKLCTVVVCLRVKMSHLHYHAYGMIIKTEIKAERPIFWCVLFRLFVNIIQYTYWCFCIPEFKGQNVFKNAKFVP